MVQFLGRMRLLLLVAMLALSGNATPAMAHAVLLGSSPLDGAVLPTEPLFFTLNFNEAVSPLVIDLVAPDGQRLDLLAETTSGQKLTIQLPHGLAPGTSVLNWRVVSIDGHPIGGASLFSVGFVTGAAPVAEPSATPVQALFWVSKLVLFVTLFVGLGGVLFGVVAWPQPMISRRMSWGLLALGGVCAPLCLGLQGLDALGAPLAALASAQPWITGWSTSFGPTALGVWLALGFAALSLRQSRLGHKRLLIAAGLVLAAMALAMSGHAGAAEPQWLTRLAVGIHIACVIFWVGALAPLVELLAPQQGPEQALRRFSAIIPWAIAGLVGSGAILTVIQLGPPSSLWLAPYGIILAAKLALVAGLLGLGLWNRFRLTQQTLAGEPVSRRQLRQTTSIELVVVLLILALVAGWRFTPPPRALAEQLAAPLELHLHSDMIMANMSVTPARVGSVSITIWLTDGAFGPLTAQNVMVSLASKALGIQAITREANQADDGSWQIKALVLPQPGIWEVTVEARVSRYELLAISGEIELN